MFKNLAMWLILVLTAGYVYCADIEKTEDSDSTSIAEQINAVEKKLNIIGRAFVNQQKEMEELKKEVEQLKETAAQLTQILRNLEIYVKAASSIRPDMSLWESIKAGMPVKEVEKILGQPEEIEEIRRVGTIWFYYGLGSINFNEQGIVREKKTFKEFPPKR